MLILMMMRIFARLLADAKKEKEIEVEQLRTRKIKDHEQKKAELLALTKLLSDSKLGMRRTTQQMKNLAPWLISTKSERELVSGKPRPWNCLICINYRATS
jgi:hypothetical protein